MREKITTAELRDDQVRDAETNYSRMSMSLWKGFEF